MLPDYVRKPTVTPPPPPPPPPPPAPPARHVEHKVQRGETLSEISTRYRTTPRQIEDANPDLRQPDALAIGQTLRVPIGEGYGVEPIDREVKPGETLAGLAAQYRQPQQELALANRHQVTPGEPLVVGQKLWIPGTRSPDAAVPSAAASPVDASVQQTDAAVQRVNLAQRQYDEINASTQGRGAALPYLSESLSTARNQLDAATKNEITLRAGPGAADAEWQQAANTVSARYRQAPDSAAAVDASVQRVTVDRQAQAIVDTARATGDPQKAVQSLSEQTAKASPEVQAALRIDDGAKQVIDDAAAWAIEPLQQDIEGAHGPQVPGREAMERLDTLTAGLDADTAARVVSAATPGIEKFVQDYQANYGGQPFGPEGFSRLVTTLGRVADAPGGTVAAERIAELGLWDDGGAIDAISQGAHPAYVLALARQPGMDSVRIMDAANVGVASFRSKIDDDVKAYGAHMEELSWLVTNHGGSMTPEQVDAAIADYKKGKGPEWEQKAESLRQTLADDGDKLLAQITALDQLPGGLEDHQARASRTIEETLADPSAQLAIQTAVQTRPEIVTGARGQRLLEFVNTSPLAASAKVADQFRKMSQEFATAHVKATVISAVGPDFDPANPASVKRATDALEALRRNTEWSRAMGLQGEALDKTIDTLKKTIPAPGESAEDVAKRLKALDDQLDGLKGFDKSTFKGQMLRGVGLAFAGVGFLASVDRAQMDPSLKNQLRIVVDAAGLGQKGFELYAGLTGASSSSTAGRLGGALASKLLGSLTAGFDAWSAAEAFSKGDVASGVLYGVGAGGGLLAALGTGSMAGPIGLGLVVVSAVGLAIVNGNKEANKHEPDSDKGVSQRFLAHAGFDEDASRALVDQSGDGRSVVPFLEQYARAQGLDLTNAADHDRYVQWVNAIPTDELAAVRDNLHRTADEFEGDPSRFEATADDDNWVVPDIAARPWFAASGVAQPESAAQLNAVLDVLGVPALS